MCIVAKHDARSIADALHPARNLRRHRKSLRHGSERETHRQTSRRSSKSVRHIEVTQQWEHHLGAAKTTAELKARSCRVQNLSGGSNVSSLVQTERHPWRMNRHRPPCIIIQVYDLDTVQTQQRAEPKLGAEIRLHRSVIVQMVPGQIREYAGRKDKTIESPLIQAVG